MDARREPEFHPGQPLPADLVIVDEASMLNLRLAEVLLGGIAESTHVVWVGDADQLPPVGAGKPFEDLIASEVVAGHPPDPDLPPGGALDDHDRRPRDEPGPPPPPRARAPTRTGTSSSSSGRAPSARWTTVVEVVAERVPEGFGVDPVRDVQVLAPMYKGRSGSMR